MISATVTLNDKLVNSVQYWRRVLGENKGKQKVRGPSRTSRNAWLQAAMDILITEGVDQVKVLNLAEKMKCARSSFYWYFKNRSELLDALLDYWAETNTRAIVSAAGQSADTINFALAKLFVGWIGGDAFDNSLDFAIRDWARRSENVRHALEVSDRARIDAITAMFVRHGYDAGEADVRARIVYFTQIGYEILEQKEDWEVRAAKSRNYLFCLTGVEPTEDEIGVLARSEYI